MKLSLAIQTPEVPVPVLVALLAGTFEEKQARAASLGADGVELMITDPSQPDTGCIWASMQQHGLEVAVIGSGPLAFVTRLTSLHAGPVCAGLAKTRLRHLIDYSAAVGSALLAVGSLRGRLSAAGTDGRERLVGTLRSAAGYAEERGVRLAVEPFNHYEADLVDNADEGLAFVSRAGRPVFGLLLDTCHVNI